MKCLRLIESVKLFPQFRLIYLKMILDELDLEIFAEIGI